jgi:cell division protein FtsI/penicillin-binding protein 2
MTGYHRFSEYGHGFGLGERAGLDIAGEAPGLVLDVLPRRGGAGMPTSFGSGIEMAPRHLAAIASVIANGGTVHSCNP